MPQRSKSRRRCVDPECRVKERAEKVKLNKEDFADKSILP